MFRFRSLLAARFNADSTRVARGVTTHVSESIDPGVTRGRRRGNSSRCDRDEVRVNLIPSWRGVIPNHSVSCSAAARGGGEAAASLLKRLSSEEEADAAGDGGGATACSTTIGVAAGSSVARLRFAPTMAFRSLRATVAAYTAAVSTSMLKSVGSQYVLSGHSERRATFGDTDADDANAHVNGHGGHPGR